jgi:hypothetical protein
LLRRSVGRRDALLGREDAVCWLRLVKAGEVRWYACPRTKVSRRCADSGVDIDECLLGLMGEKRGKK